MRLTTAARPEPRFIWLNLNCNAMQRWVPPFERREGWGSHNSEHSTIPRERSQISNRRVTWPWLRSPGRLSWELKSEESFADGIGMSASAIALQGLENADAQLNATAEAIVTDGTAPSSGGPSVPDLATDMVLLTSAQTLAEANMASLKTADQLEQNLIDMTA
jgi:hypothetical protein